MLAMVVGCKPPTPVDMIVPLQRGHFGHFPYKLRVIPRAVNCQRSLLGRHPWTSWAGRGGRLETGVVFICGGELRSRIRVRLGSSVGMDWVPILDQYLMREMVPVLLLAVAVCSSLGMSLGALAGLIREVTVSGLPLRVAGAAAVLQLPYFAAVSMPTACLAASLFGLGRLQSDMESVALFAAGVPLWRMLLAPLCICLVGAALKLACHNYLVPYGSSQARKMVETALTTHMQGLRQTADLIYQEYGTTEDMGEDGRRMPSRRSYGLQRIWYASKMEGARLAGLLLLEVLPSGYVHRVVVGDAAEWQMDESTWKFSNSTVLDVSPVGSTRRILQMDGLRVPSTPLTSGRAFRKRTLHELSRSEIVSEITRLQSSNGRDRVIDVQMLNKLECFLCQRDAAAFSCVVYGLIGALATLAPSGRRGSRSVSHATPFAWAIVATLIFSAAVAVAMALGSTGALNPWLSAWVPPLLGFGIILLVIFGPSELQQRQRKLASHAKKLGKDRELDYRESPEG